MTPAETGHPRAVGFMSEVAQRLSRLFEGFQTAYGTYDHSATVKSAVKNGKVEIKATAKTIRGKVILAMWEAHIAGHTPLGIIPICEDGTCFWGCIDVDKYDTSHVELIRQIAKYRYPLVVCRTKSGGAHLFLFVRPAIPATEMQAKLKDMAARLGVGNSEIFPKQTAILTERGDLGNWLNMPYFAGDKTDRYCFKESMAGMTLKEFLDYAETKRVSELNGVVYEEPDKDGLEDGPPCLQHLTTVGFPEGTRNNGLFALGVFAKKKYGENWQEKLEEFNREFMNPPLPAEEVAQLVKNIDKKDYNYRCSDQPCVSYCNSTLCRTRKYGVGGSDEFPVLTGLSFLDSDPPLWFADVDGQRIELTTDQLQNYRVFHKAAMEKLHICYMMLKQDTWFRMVGAAMRDAIRIEVSDEVGTRGHFMELLEDFCYSRHRGDSLDDLMSGKPYEDEDQRRIYFRLRDFMEFLDRHKFAAYGKHQVANEIRKMGGHSFFNVRGKGCNAWWIKSGQFDKTEPAKLPESQKEVV